MKNKPMVASEERRKISQEKGGDGSENNIVWIVTNSFPTWNFRVLSVAKLLKLSGSQECRRPGGKKSAVTLVTCSEALAEPRMRGRYDSICPTGVPG